MAPRKPIIATVSASEMPDENRKGFTMGNKVSVMNFLMHKSA